MEAEKERGPECVEGELDEKEQQGDPDGPVFKALLPDQECGDSHEQVEGGPDGAEEPAGGREEGLV